VLEHWHPYLIWTEQPFIIETDHKNLIYWKSPKKLTGRTARWHEKLQDYNFKILHIPGKTNTPADALSRPNGQDIQESTKEVSLIPPEAFLQLFGPDLDDSLESRIVEGQLRHRRVMEEWAKDLPIHELDGAMWKDIPGNQLVVPPDDEVKQEILWVWHEHKGGGHQGRDETVRQVNRHYFWPRARPWVEQYVKGCAICQQNKNLTYKAHTPLYKITVPKNAPPFTQIAMDLITGLPKSRGFDSILTIVDHGCSRGTIFLPCQSMVTGPQITQMYYQHMYPWFRLPSQIISDRDPRFISHFGKSLAKELGVTWNLSTAYHPQMDGLSERKNQWVEQFLQLVANNQEDWSTVLPLATLVHNNSQNATIRTSPNQLLIGLEPPATPSQAEGASNPLAEQRVRQLRERLSPPSPVPPWVQWSNELAREMYIKHALQWLELQYPCDPDDS